MLTATQLLYEAMGRPELPNLEPCSGACFLCGGSAALGRPAVLPPTFMDYDKARCPAATHICAACWHSMDERNEQLAALGERLSRTSGSYDYNPGAGELRVHLV